MNIQEGSGTGQQEGPLGRKSRPSIQTNSPPSIETDWLANLRFSKLARLFYDLR